MYATVAPIFAAEAVKAYESVVLRRLLVSRKATMKIVGGNSSCSTDSIKMYCRVR
jgi:hypothetical protein